MKIRISRRGAIFGPFEVEKVLAYRESGRLLPSDWAWAPGMKNWVGLEDFLADMDSSGPLEKPSDDEISANLAKIKELLDKGRVEHAFDLLSGSREHQLYEVLLQELLPNDDQPVCLGGESRFWLDLLVECPPEVTVPSDLLPQNISSLSLARSPWLESLEFLREWESLEDLNLNGCDALTSLEALYHLPKLKSLEASGRELEYSPELLEFLKDKAFLSVLEGLAIQNFQNPKVSREILNGLAEGDFLDQVDPEAMASILMDVTSGVVRNLETEASLAEPLFNRLAVRATTAEACLKLVRCSTYETCCLPDFAMRIADKAVGFALEEGLNSDLLGYFWEACDDEYFDYTDAIYDLVARLDEFSLGDFADYPDSWPETFDSYDWGEKSMPCPAMFKKLRKLDLSETSFSEVPSDLSEMKKLEELDLSGTSVESLSPVLQDLPNLKILLARECEHLEDVRYLVGLTQLAHLDLEGCCMLTRFPDISGLKNLKTLNLKGCDSLENGEIFKDLQLDKLALPDHLL